MCDQNMLEACFRSWKAYVSCLTYFDVSQHSFQLFDADVDFRFRVFVVQFVVVAGNVPTTIATRYNPTNRI